MKKKTTKDYAIALYDATKDLKGKKLEQVLGNFVRLVARDQKLKQAERIIAEFIRYAKKQEGIQDITITSAHELDAKMKKEIEESFGEKVESAQTVDKGLLGGFVVKTADKIFNASLKQQLNRFRLKLE